MTECGFVSYLESGLFSDVILIVGGTEYPTHKVILCESSELLSELLRRRFLESSSPARSSSPPSSTPSAASATSPALLEDASSRGHRRTKSKHKHHRGKGKKEHGDEPTASAAGTNAPPSRVATVVVVPPTPPETSAEGERSEPVEKLELNLRDTGAFPVVLRYMYGDPVKVTEENAVQLLSVASQLVIPTLVRQVEEYTTTSITSANALAMLRKAADLGREELVLRCVLVIARNFSTLVSEKGPGILSHLPYDSVLAILRHDSLAVETEAHVYDVACSYAAQLQGTGDDAAAKQAALFETVRFPLLDYEKLEVASKNPMVPREVLAEGLLSRLGRYECPSNPEAQKRAAPRREFARIFEYTSDFDEHGVLYYIATRGGTEEWRNPMLAREQVRVSWSSLEKGSPHSVLEREPSESWSMDVPSSWVQLDLGEDRSLVLSHYSIRHGSNSRQDFLRNWVLQGSDDGKTWEVLQRHVNDTALNNIYATHSWAVIKSPTPRRIFRVLQNGRNSSTHNFLSISGIELYGELHERKKGKPAVPNPAGAGGAPSASAPPV